ncbi:MAG: T9SS type A sorting domain-containing protein [Pedobacter sp.]|nr:T9SS type A sorting domain-containing protein [Pedobacter sp.]
MCMSLSFTVFAQKPDSSASAIRYKKLFSTPQIKGSVQSFRPKYNFGFIPYSEVSVTSKTTTSLTIKQDKLLSVLKVYPNPVEDQVNLVIKMDRESNFSVKIMDLLGNEVVTLANERAAAGEQTKTYNVPERLNPGIYFLKIISGSETVVKRISVL